MNSTWNNTNNTNNTNNPKQNTNTNISKKKN